MPVHKIQLRGLSRTPSDRMTSDGGCAESLNVICDQDELAPATSPKDITASLGLPTNQNYSPFYIHQTPEFKHIICEMTSDGRIGCFIDGTWYNIFTLDFSSYWDDERVTDITSIGNTLIISSQFFTHYAIWSNGTYRYLGTEIPDPCVTFTTNFNADSELKNKVMNLASGKELADISFVEGVNKGIWQAAIDGTLWEEDALKGQQTIFDNLQEKIWRIISNMKTKAINAGHFTAPVLARYALRLYDGSFVRISSPILLGAGADFWMESKISRVYNGSKITSDYSVSLNSIYDVIATLDTDDFEGWEDIIESVDIFLSTDIAVPLQNAKIVGLNLISGSEDYTATGTTTYQIIFDGMADGETDVMKDAILGKASFYKVGSYRVDHYSELSKGVDLGKETKYRSMDYLATQEELGQDNEIGRTYRAEKIATYNERMIASGLTASLSHGNRTLTASSIKSDIPVSSAETYIFKYYIKDENGGAHVVYSRGSSLQDGSRQKKITGASKAAHYAFLTHPDARCYKVDVYYSGKYKSLDMQRHPMLPCAYYYGGVGNRLSTIVAGGTAITESSFLSAGESTTYSQDNMVMASEAKNPFVFPLGQRFRYTGSVIGFAMATTALSSGQFGQFPLYVFTTDGIWALATDDAGEFVSSKPVARDVAIAGKICSIDQGVVFFSNKGVMLLQGSQVSCLSSTMTGQPWTIETSAKEITDARGFTNLGAAMTDTRGFIDFIASGSPYYDYAGNRLILLNGARSYAFVYKFDTQTWHKYKPDTAAALGDGVTVRLNSYPDCWIAGLKKIMDFSTYRDVGSTTTSKCIVATRAIDLDQPDVLKSIYHLKIRGHYQKFDSSGNPRVSYILLGSQDGIKYVKLGSLRGKSWKMFRIIIMAELGVNERLSWIDIEYTTRFNNKLR